MKIGHQSPLEQREHTPQTIAVLRTGAVATGMMHIRHTDGYIEVHRTGGNALRDALTFQHRVSNDAWLRIG